jgi:hypothetical protein
MGHFLGAYEYHFTATATLLTRPPTDQDPLSSASIKNRGAAGRVLVSNGINLEQDCGRGLPQELADVSRSRSVQPYEARQRR